MLNTCKVGIECNVTLLIYVKGQLPCNVLLLLIYLLQLKLSQHVKV